MESIQWIIAAGTAIFVALVGFFQWRTNQQKSALDLFERRHAIYQVIREAVGQIRSSSARFDAKREQDFLEAIERAYFFFGDDVQKYLDSLWQDIVTITSLDKELPGITDPEDRRKNVQERRVAFDRIGNFYTDGKRLFAKYMRFSQRVNWIN
jgi:hypothetical protein